MKLRRGVLINAHTHIHTHTKVAAFIEDLSEWTLPTSLANNTDPRSVLLSFVKDLFLQNKYSKGALKTPSDSTDALIDCQNKSRFKA